MNRRFPFFTFSVAAASVLIQLIPGAPTGLQFERGAAIREFWRFCTAHLTHFEWNHLGWDVGVWLVLGCMCERISRDRFAVATAASSIAITAAVWLWQPQFQTYRGLSGLDCTLFGLIAGSKIETRQRGAVLLGVIALAGAGAKCAFELATTSTLFAAGNSYAPVPLAHLIGLAIGAVATFPWARFRGSEARAPIRA
jgi:rhomboid family GlyGly-CTERM serine protease